MLKFLKNIMINGLNIILHLRMQKFFMKQETMHLKKVNGDFIAFLDVDDWWVENKLEKQIPLFDDAEIGLVYGNFWLFYQRTKRKKIFKRKLPSGMIVNNLLNDYVIGSATYVIRKNFLDQRRNIALIKIFT